MRALDEIDWGVNLALIASISLAIAGVVRQTSAKGGYRTITVKVWHLLVVGALAVSALTAVLSFVLVGRGMANETRTLALVPATMPKAMAKETAAANVRAAVPSIEAFHTDHGTYAGATVAALRRDYDSGIDPFVKLGWGDKTRYCIESTVGGQTMSVTQPGTDILSGGC